MAGRRRVAAAASLLLALAGAVALVTADAALAAPAATQTVLTANPTTGSPQGQTVQFLVSVMPTAATGTAVLRANGTTVATGPVVNGIVSFGLANLPLGTDSMAASFAPDDETAWSASTSAPVDVRIVGDGRIVLANAGGSTIPQGTKIAVGTPIYVTVSGFPASSQVSLTLSGAALSSTITTNGSGVGKAIVVLPTTLSSTVYTLLAEAQGTGASFTFYVYNPVAATTTPTPVVSASPSPTPTVIVAPVVYASASPTSGSSSLAHTGSDDILQLVLGALLSLLLGVGFLVWASATTPERGRHARVAGSHARLR